MQLDRGPWAGLRVQHAAAERKGTNAGFVRVRNTLLPVLQAETPQQDDLFFQMLMLVPKLLLRITTDTVTTSGQTTKACLATFVVRRKD